jgi:predicted AlkP superfamily pyrophosphatase or phosphodiesterase
LIVLDGSRPDYFNLASMPNLKSLERRGTRYTKAFVGQEIANTPPSHATIGTGLFPKHHGIEGFWWKDPNTGQMTRPTDITQVQHGDLERILRQHHVSSIASSLKQQNPAARIVAISGHKCYAADAMGTSAADYILCANIYHGRWVAQAIPGHLPPPGAVNNPRWDVPIPPPHSSFGAAVQQWKVGEENDWTVHYALWAFKRVHYPRAILMNLPETDVTGHFSKRPGSVQRILMQHFDRELGWIMGAYRKAGLLNRTDFVITADHGMSFIRDRIPFSTLDEAMALAHSGKVYLEADTGASMGVQTVSRAAAVARNVARLDYPEIDAVYYKVFAHGSWTYRTAYASKALTVYMRRAYLALANTDASASGADVLAMYAPHVTTGDRIANGYHWWAGHLGPGWDEQHIPLIISGPGVRRGYVSNYPARLVDLAPTVERLLRSPPTKTDGLVLADALTSRTRHEVSTQAKEGAVLLPLVKALEQRTLNATAP